MPKSSKRGKNKWGRVSENSGHFTIEHHDIAGEKRKARELRNSPWWRRKRSSGICYYCRRKFLPDELTMDHLIPLSRGGRSERYNIVPACKDCNNRKKYLLPAEWDEYIDNIKNTKL